MIAVISGTGFCDSNVFKKVEKKRIKTPFGLVPDVSIGRWGAKKIVFLPRHGRGHDLPPHKVNYRANIYALKKLGVERIIAINSVGGINPLLKPRDIVVPYDFIDFTNGRESTFYEDEVVHVDVTTPYCPEIKKALIDGADEFGKVFSNAVYACTQGPRFETSAEIQMLSKLDCDVVGMTGYPEVVLAREQEICYATVCTVTNYAAGIAKQKLTATEVIEIVKENEEKIKRIIRSAVDRMPEKRACACGRALEDARV